MYMSKCHQLTLDIDKFKFIRTQLLTPDVVILECKEKIHVQLYQLISFCFVMLYIYQPYFPTPKGEEATQYMMRRIAPRRVWPVIAFGASLACWYEHVSRTICLLICKNHRLWEFLTKLITRNRYVCVCVLLFVFVYDFNIVPNFPTNTNYSLYFVKNL